MLILKTGAKKLLIKTAAVIFFSAVFVFPAEAAVIFNKIGPDNTVTELTTRIANWFLSITAGVAILFFIIGGIYYLTASGDDKRMEEGKRIITYTIYGLVLILISYSIVTTLNKIIFE